MNMFKSLIKKTKLFLFVVLCGMMAFSSNIAFAETKEAAKIEDVMCNAYKIFNGPLGKTFAVFAIVALGLGFFLGKVSWGTAIAVAVGVGAIFGAPALVNVITGGGAVCGVTAENKN